MDAIAPFFKMAATHLSDSVYLCFLVSCALCYHLLANVFNEQQANTDTILLLSFYHLGRAGHIYGDLFFIGGAVLYAKPLRL